MNQNREGKPRLVTDLSCRKTQPIPTMNDVYYRKNREHEKARTDSLLNKIKPIPTIYQQHKFRSRIEARWAVFYDVLGIKWEYEKEGYSLPSGWYLPDFWLPDQEYWIEIKGKEPTEDEKLKCAELVAYSKKPLFIFYGAIPIYELIKDHKGSESILIGFTLCSKEPFESKGSFAWCYCDTCKQSAISSGLTAPWVCRCEIWEGRFGAGVRELLGLDSLSPSRSSASSAKLKLAYTLASQYNFISYGGE